MNDYLTVYEIWKNDCVVLTTTDEQGQMILKEQKTPESLYLKKEAYQKLSNEAKEIIMTIINAPAEMVEIFSPKLGKVNINKVISYFKNKIGNRKTKLAVKEITKFVDNL